MKSKIPEIFFVLFLGSFLYFILFMYRYPLEPELEFLEPQVKGGLVADIHPSQYAW